MSTTAIIVIALVALVLIAALAAWGTRRRREHIAAERERLVGVAGAHAEQSELTALQAREIAAEAAHHHEEAERADSETDQLRLEARKLGARMKSVRHRAAEHEHAAELADERRTAASAAVVRHEDAAAAARERIENL